MGPITHTVQGARLLYIPAAGESSIQGYSVFFPPFFLFITKKKKKAFLVFFTEAEVSVGNAAACSFVSAHQAAPSL